MEKLLLVHHLKNRDQLELNSIIDTIDSKSDSINSNANMKANLQDTDVWHAVSLFINKIFLT